jgi:hypothetical protein
MFELRGHPEPGLSARTPISSFKRLQTRHRVKLRHGRVLRSAHDECLSWLGGGVAQRVRRSYWYAQNITCSQHDRATIPTDFEHPCLKQNNLALRPSVPRYVRAGLKRQPSQIKSMRPIRPNRALRETVAGAVRRNDPRFGASANIERRALARGDLSGVDSIGRQSIVGTRELIPMAGYLSHPRNSVRIVNKAAVLQPPRLSLNRFLYGRSRSRAYAARQPLHDE